MGRMRAACFAFLWVPAYAGMTEGVMSEPRIAQIFADAPHPFVGFHPHPRFKPGAGSGFPPARERRSVLGCVFGSRFVGV